MVERIGSETAKPHRFCNLNHNLRVCFLAQIILSGGLTYLTQSWSPLVIGGVLLVLVLIGISLYSAALNGIYRAEVYLYAVDGRAGGDFDPQLIAGAFQPRSSRRAFRW